MSKKRGTGKRFKKGISGNPEGRPKLPAELNEFRKASKETIVLEFKELWALSYDEVKKISDNNDQPVIRKVIAKAIVKAADSGKMDDFNPILDRVHGPVTKTFEGNLNHNMNIHSEIVNIIQEIEGESDGEKSSEENEEDLN